MYLMTLYYTAFTEEERVHQCYLHGLFQDTVQFSGVLLIPMYEFLFFPLFHWFLAKINSQRKFILGVLLLIAATIIVVGFVSVTNLNFQKTNDTATMYNSTETTVLDYRWLAIPSFLRSVSVALLLIGAIEFIVSQTPYSMRGLIMGTAHAMLGLYTALGVAINIPFTDRSTEHFNSGISFWYAQLLLIMELLVGILLILIMRWYKKRKREDVLPNEHIFAERYYERET